MSPRAKGSLSKGDVAGRYISIGAIVGIVLIILFFKKTFCFYAYQPGGKLIPAILAGIGTLLGVLIKYVPTAIRNFIRKNEEFILFICGLLLMSAVVIFVSPLFYKLDTNSCVDGFDELTTLLDQEGKAVIGKDMSIIRNIYYTDAIVTRETTGESWPAYIYYSNKFVTEDHCSNSRGNLDVISATSSEVTITTSSQGTWGYAGQGCNQIYDNPLGSDQWTFQRIKGEWKIVNFKFK